MYMNKQQSIFDSKEGKLQYKNGNFSVLLLSDGTKIRILDENETEFKAAFPENIDLKISNKCSLGCEFCHEGSCPSGKISEALDKYGFLNSKYLAFIQSLKPGTELAIGGGALSEVPFLEYLLFSISVNNIISNITVNSKELLNEDFFNLILKYTKLEDTNISKYSLFLKNNNIKNILPSMHTYIYGLGISYSDIPECKEKMKQLKMLFPNSVVIHTIYGVTKKEDYDWLAENGFKVLVLGYKNFRKGEVYLEKNKDNIEKNMKDFKDNIQYYFSKCRRLSFDCLACEQLNLKSMVDPKVWETNYMGNDGQFTMYVDLVEDKFALNSTSTERYDCKDFKFSAPLMFKKIRNKSLKNNK